MNKDLTDKEAKWARNIWASYWCIIAVHFLAQLFSYWFLPYQAHFIEFYFYVLLEPTLYMSGAVGAAWFVSRWERRYTFYSLFVAGTVVAVMIIRLNTDIGMISALFLLPILASVIFYRVRLTLFSAALQLIAFVLLYLGDESYRGHLTDFDLVAVPCFLGLCTLISSMIMIRGHELQKELYETMAAKQELMGQYSLLRRQSQIDSLTGLYNQASFHEYFGLAMDYGAGEPGASFHLALIDIDDFKSINDTYGHRTGDLVLSRVAEAIRDFLPATGIAARYGGEEFALLLLEPSNEDAVRVAETIRTAVSRIQHQELGGNKVTVSIGITSYEPAMGKDEMFEQADRRLYKAKRTGKNRTVSSS